MNIKSLLNPVNIKNKVVGFIKSIPSILRATYLAAGFFVLLFIYLFSIIYEFFEKIPFVGRLFKTTKGVWDARLGGVFDRLIAKIEKKRGSQVKSIYLIRLAHRNLLIKKTRSFITILGMSVGVGIIVLLLSLGYGIEKLIISRVARLDELKMIDVSAGENTSNRLNKKVIDKIKKLSKVEKVLPVVSVVGRVTYNRASTDVLVYATQKDYIDSLNLKLKKGKLFANNEGVDSLNNVAGATTEVIDGKVGTSINDQTIKFNIYPQEFVPIRLECDINSRLIGYVVRTEGGYYKGEEYWGREYAPFEKGRAAFDREKNIFLGKWIKANLPIYRTDADGSVSKALDKENNQIWMDGCIQEKYIQIGEVVEMGSVLGEATSSADLETATDSASTTYETVSVGSDSAGLETVSLAASSSASKKTTQELKFEKQPSGEAVVSSGLLNLLNISESKALGKTFKASFIIVKSLIPEIDSKAMTSEVEYKIIGIIDDDESTYFYIPFIDINLLGIKNYSQIRVILANANAVNATRKEIETLGFKTSSTVDTVKQIESLFANLRILLGIVGLVALGVASLGMFNTLTVSLLERTREIGGMKAMGMVSQEVQDLFLAEAMIMGLAGGVGGLLMGYLTGELLSLLISLVAIASGQGYLHLNYLPFYFISFILLSSFVVGVITGLYPAQRAKKISALNALRYE